MKFLSFFASAFFLGAAAFAAAVEGPEATIKACFTDYVRAIEKEGGNTDQAAVRARCLTKSFQRKWEKGGEHLEADPLINAQDTQPTWNNQVMVANLDSDAKSLFVIIGAEPEAYCLKVTYKTDAGGVRIASSRVCR